MSNKRFISIALQNLYNCIRLLAVSSCVSETTENHVVKIFVQSLTVLSEWVVKG